MEPPTCRGGPGTRKGCEALDKGHSGSGERACLALGNSPFCCWLDFLPQTGWASTGHPGPERRGHREQGRGSPLGLPKAHSCPHRLVSLGLLQKPCGGMVGGPRAPYAQSSKGTGCSESRQRGRSQSPGTCLFGVPS